MEQSRLRVGDTLDDYCPRERRLTTHAVVALVEDRVKQTRCMTCDFEHAFKDGKLPSRRKKPEVAVAFAPQRPDSTIPAQMVAASPGRLAAVPLAEDLRLIPSSEGQVRPEVAAPGHEGPDALALAAASDGRGDVHEAAVHRRLIRATLPRQEGQAPTPRPIPEFTIRHATSANAYGRRTPEGYRASSGDGKFRGDRGQFGATRRAAGGHQRGGSQPQRFGKKGSR